MTTQTPSRTDTASPTLATGSSAGVLSTPFSTRLVVALLALSVTVVHVADQGGIANFTDPNWLGWSYRLIEVGGLATAAVVLLAPKMWASWAAAALLAAGPFVGYLLSRTIALPDDSDDKGNWNDWVGTLSLLLEAALLILACVEIVKLRRATRRSADVR